VIADVSDVVQIAVALWARLQPEHPYPSLLLATRPSGIGASDAVLCNNRATAPHPDSNSDCEHGVGQVDAEDGAPQAER